MKVWQASARCQSNAAATGRAEMGVVEIHSASEAEARKFNPKTAAIPTRDLQT